MEKKDLEKAIEKLYSINLNVKKEERVLVFSDNIRDEEKITEYDRKRRNELLKVAEKTFEVGSKITNATFISYGATMIHGAEPPEFLWEEAFGKKIYSGLRDRGILLKLINKRGEINDLLEAEELVQNNREEAVDVVIAMANFSVSHTKFRDLLTKSAEARFASLPLFDPSMFFTSMDVDWDLVSSRTIAIADKLTKAQKVRITSPNGTEITMKLKGRKGIADTGILRSEGSFGNLPAGEAFIAPVEGSTEGKLVVEWGLTEPVKPPVVLEIKNGKVFLVQGVSKFAADLREKFGENPFNKNIAEFGIGTNYKASRVDNILEAEKIAGTIHIALGDNMSFGGNVRTSFHQDFVVFAPTVILEYEDGKSEVIVNKNKIVCVGDK